MRNLKQIWWPFAMTCLVIGGCSPSGGQGGDAQVAVDGAQPDGGSPPGDGAVAPDGAPVDAEVVTCEGEIVARHGTAELVLQAASAYSGSGGSPNPFTDVSVTATVTAPDGSTYQVDGFYDGDGAGGNDGDVFKVRVYVAQHGQYSWTIQSSDSGLDGQAGQICGQGLLGGVFGGGPVAVNPTHPRYFMYGDGAPVYLVGKFLDVAAPDPIKFSHTMFSEELTDANRQAMLDRHLSMGLNKINVYLANQGDYGSVSTTPWLGSASSNDKTRFNLTRWHRYDQWTRTLRDEGLAAQLWFFADDSGFGGLPDAARQRLIRYGMARLSAYANTLFTLCLEWQEGWSTSEVNSHAEHIQQHNPWERLVSVHGVTGGFDFPDAAWADYMDIQSGNDASHATVHSMGVTNRALAAKPLINEEFGLGDEDATHRRRAWAAFTAGGAGSGTGSFLLHLVTFANSVPFERMDPCGVLIDSGAAYCLGEVGAHYVVYLFNGGTVGLDLSAASGTLDVSWLDPRTGATTVAGTVSGGGVESFSAPGSGDWVLYVSVP